MESQSSKSIEGNNGPKSSKSDENSDLTDPRISLNPDRNMRREKHIVKKLPKTGDGEGGPRAHRHLKNARVLRKKGKPRFRRRYH